MQTCLRASGGESFFQLSISRVYIEKSLENNAFSSSSEKDQFMSGAQFRAQAQFIEFTGYPTSSSSTKLFFLKTQKHLSSLLICYILKYA